MVGRGKVGWVQVPLQLSCVAPADLDVSAISPGVVTSTNRSPDAGGLGVWGVRMRLGVVTVLG